MKSYGKLKTDSSSNGGHHYSGTVTEETDITKPRGNLLAGECAKCNRKKPTAVTDNT